MGIHSIIKPNMENQEENQQEILDNFENELMWFVAIQTAKKLADNTNKTEEENESLEKLMKNIKVLEEHTLERLLYYKKELNFCQTMICILSAKDKTN